jgi:hypothetical protein
MNTEEEGLVRYVALFMSFILVVAIVGWVVPIAGAAEGEEDKVLTDAELKALVDGFFDNGKMTQSISFVFTNKGIEVAAIPLNSRTISVPAGTVKDIDALRAAFGDKVDGDGLLTIDYGNGKRTISLNKDEIPSNLESIKVGVHGDKVTYQMKDDKGSVVISQEGVVLVANKAVSSGGPAELLSSQLIKGYKVGEEEIPLSVTMGEGGEIKIPGEDGKGVSYGKGASLTLTGETAIDLTTFESVSDESGNIEFVGSKSDFVVRNSVVNGPDFGLKVAGAGVYFGDKDNVPDNMNEKEKEKYLTLEGDKLSGNLAGIGEEKVFFKNKGKKPLQIDGLTEVSDQTIPVGEEATIYKKDGKVQVDVKPDSGATTTPTSTNGKEPELPTTRTPPPGVGTPPNPNGTTTPPTPHPIPPRGPEGPDGGSNWLLWAAIIGGAILAAMLLFGGGDEKKDTEDNNETDDGGEPYMGEDDEPVPKEIRSGEGQDNKTFSYNPSTKSGGSCDVNSSGYFNCPGDDCSRCTSVNSGPLTQGLDVLGNETSAGNETNTTN